MQIFFGLIPALHFMRKNDFPFQSLIHCFVEVENEEAFVGETIESIEKEKQKECVRGCPSFARVIKHSQVYEVNQHDISYLIC